MISKNNSFKDITEKIKFYISNFTVNIKKIIKKPITHPKDSYKNVG